MAEKICSFKDYLKCKDDKKLSKTRSKINRKRKDGSSKNVYGWAGYGFPRNLSGNGSSDGSNGNGSTGTNGMSGNGGSAGGNGGGMGEGYRGYHKLDDEKENPKQIFKNSKRGLNWVNNTYEEEAEDTSKKAQARTMYRNLRNQGLSRQEIIDQFQNQIQLTPSSAVAYYERIAREFGETEDQSGEAQMPPGADGAGGMAGPPGGAGGMMPPGGQMNMGTQEPPEPPMEKQEWDDPNRQGDIRTVDGAHLVYKRQVDDGSFEELWVLKQGEKFHDELDIRRDVLAGTDIPANKTKSDDGSQTSDSWNVGNIQYLQILGLPN